MTVAPKRSDSARRPRVLSGLVAVLLALAGVLVAPVAAQAEPEGYWATTNNSSKDAEFDNFGGNRFLTLMTVGQSYSGSVTGPQFSPGMEWCWLFWEGVVPEGLTVTGADTCTPSLSFSGTPTTAGTFWFQYRLADTANETSYILSFEGSVVAGKTPTTTSLTLDSYAPYDEIAVSATVEPTEGTAIPTGQVEFRSGSTVLGSGTLVDGVVQATLEVDRDEVGEELTVTAHYLGDDDFSTSASAAKATTVYARDAVGTVTWNGIPVEGAEVKLIAEPEGHPWVVAVSGTDETGRFELWIMDTGEAGIEGDYILHVTLPDETELYYKAGAYNVVEYADAGFTRPLEWGSPLHIERRTPPSWTDQTVTGGRVDKEYSDGVGVSSHNDDVEFTVSAGSLPPGLELDDETGAITGTPTEEGEFTFTVKADNGYGSITKELTITILRAGIPPTWEDEELPEFRVDVAVNDGVLAEGDETIVYSVTDGALPDGLTLNPATGRITGTPTTVGAYYFVITAENEFGSIDTEFTGEVGGAPDLGLKLDFKPGTSIEDARSTISAEGLKVGSEYVLTMFSTPRVLYTGIVDATGGFTWQVKLPKDTPAGAHRLVLTGIAADGRAMSATAWFSLGTDGKIIAISYTGPVAGGLADTGAEPLNTGIPGLILLVLGVGAVVVARRSQRAAELG